MPSVLSSQRYRHMSYRSSPGEMLRSFSSFTSISYLVGCVRLKSISFRTVSSILKKSLLVQALSVTSTKCFKGGEYTSQYFEAIHRQAAPTSCSSCTLMGTLVERTRSMYTTAMKSVSWDSLNRWCTLTIHSTRILRISRVMVASTKNSPSPLGRSRDFKYSQRLKEASSRVIVPPRGLSFLLREVWECWLGWLVRTVPKTRLKDLALSCIDSNISLIDSPDSHTFNSSNLTFILMLGLSKAVNRFSSGKNLFGKPTYIVAAKRTPIGAFLGKLSTYTGPELGAITIKAALESAKITPQLVDEVILGNVISAGLGQAPARQASIKAGLPTSVPCTTVNKVCSSGMKSVMLGSQSIALGQNNIVITGGFESMSNVPFYVQNHRKGFAFGEQKLIDGLAYDGLTDAFNGVPMGNCGEKTATDMKIGRKEQDDFAILSYERVIEATKSGAFKDEVVPVKVAGKGEEWLSEDEEHKRFNKEKMASLKTVFNKTGTITAANASKINDGAATIILASEEAVKAHNLTPLARIVGYADAQLDPMDFCIAPHLASKKVLERTGLSISQIDFMEFNEAFSVTVLANLKLLDVPVSKMNVHGGAVAMGHPIGMSGARIIQSLITVLTKNKKKYGLAAICNGGGGSSAMIIENLRQ